MGAKLEYARRMPADLSPLEVVRRAKAEGITLSAATVYAARRRGVVSTNVMNARGELRGNDVLAASAQERQYLELTMEMGFTRAAGLIEALRQHLAGE